MSETQNPQISIDINASPSKVWSTLIDPLAVKEYMMGADVETDWEVGSPISWKGEWEGQPFEDTGKVLAFENEKMLSYDHNSSSGGEDVPENHRTVTVVIEPKGEGTHLELTQSKAGSAEDSAEMEENWRKMFDRFKQIAER